MSTGYKKVRLTIEMVVEDNDKLSWVAENIWEQLNRGEDITDWDYEILEGDVEPIMEKVYE
jgi:hypothetical protein